MSTASSTRRSARTMESTSAAQLLNLPTGGDDSRRARRATDLGIASLFFILYAVVCFIMVIWHCGGFNQRASTSFIWALACTTVGGAFCFLFGIPKILQSDRLPEDTPNSAVIGYRQQVNTNLTEISDWLTKIIVGLSLINLAKIPPVVIENL